METTPKQYVYLPEIGRLNGSSFETQTEVFLSELYRTVKGIVDNAFINAQQALEAAIIANDIARKALETAQRAEDNSLEAVNTSRDALVTSNQAVATAENAVSIAQAAEQRATDAENAAQSAATSAASADASCQAAEAAAQASAAAADASAQDAYRSRLFAEWHEIATWNIAGTWTINNLVLGKPLLIVTYAPSYGDNEITSNASGGPALIFWPTTTSISINIPKIEQGTILKAYQ